MEQEDLLPLLCQTAEGNKDAFAKLYALTSPQLYAVAMKMLRQNALAEEATQDAFVKVWHNANTYQRGKGTVLTWMVSIVRYRALDIIRYHGVRHEVELSDYQDVAAETDEEERWLSPSVQSDKLDKCLKELDDDQRQAIHLAYFNGMSHQEVENHLSSPLGTIKSWIRRGLQSLQRCLAL